MYPETSIEYKCDTTERVINLYFTEHDECASLPQLGSSERADLIYFVIDIVRKDFAYLYTLSSKVVTFSAHDKVGGDFDDAVMAYNDINSVDLPA